MPKIPAHALIWSDKRGVYELYPADPQLPDVVPGEEEAWFAWVAMHTSFSFRGQGGRLNVLKEARSRGAGYWYAYHSHQGQTRKRYLGRTAALTLAHLEAVAQVLGTESASQGGRTEAVQASRYSIDTNRARGTRTRKPAPSLEIPLSSLAPPPVPNSLVERESLLSRLDAALAHPLTLVSAGAGWGKTTLLAQMASRHRERIAWLSLSELDNSPTRFWVGLITALRRRANAHRDLGQTAVTLLESPQPPELSAILTMLLNELASRESHPVPTVLILDDYQVINDPSIHEGLAFWVEHQPVHLHLILSSRVDPDLPLARLRVRGQLTEIREADLRFGEAEASRYLGHMLSAALSTEEVHLLTRRTEGWVAGLQLAALALQKRADRAAFLQAFTGSQRYLLDYVQEEILSRLSTPARDFLLRTAILSHLDASVCQAVTAAPTTASSQQMLVFLERANLFLVPLDEERHIYRLHDLFREALLARLHTDSPQLVHLLHLRAARFYETQREWREAITHALAASHYAYAASLMEKASKLFWFRGEVRMIHTWLFSLPDVELRAHLPLALDCALRFFDAMNLSNETLHSGMATQVAYTFTRLESLLAAASHWTLTEAEVALVERRVCLLHALIELRGILAQNKAERLRDLILELEALPPDEEASWNIVPLYLTFWLTTVYQGYGIALIPRLHAVKQQVLQTGDVLMATRVLSWLSFLCSIYAAQLHQGQHEALSALALVEQNGAHNSWEGYLYYCLFGISYAWNRLEEASHWLKLLLHFAQGWQHLQMLVEGETFAVQLGLAQRDLAAAREALHRLEALLEQEKFAHHAPWVTVLRVKVWLAEGKLTEAAAWAEYTPFSFESWNPLRRWELLMLVRVLLARKQYQQAVEMLARLSQYLDREGSIDTVLEFRALSVVALHHAGKSAQAARVAAHLFAITEPEGHLRVYLDEGDPMKQALQSLLNIPSDQQEGKGTLPRGYISRLLSAFEQEEHQHAEQVKSQPANSHEMMPLLPAVPTTREEASASSALPLLEPLTAQEQRVLRLLAAGRSTREIAESLVVSVNTVKTHLKNLYSKLQVKSRTQASAVARERHLL